jgi:hypothetical protein
MSSKYSKLVLLLACNNHLQAMDTSSSPVPPEPKRKHHHTSERIEEISVMLNRLSEKIDAQAKTLNMLIATQPQNNQIPQQLHCMKCHTELSSIETSSFYLSCELDTQKMKGRYLKYPSGNSVLSSRDNSTFSYPNERDTQRMNQYIRSSSSLSSDNQQPLPIPAAGANVVPGTLSIVSDDKIIYRLRLLAAAKTGNLETVKDALDHGICPWTPDSDVNNYYTPLHWAAALGHIEVVKVLLAKGPKLCICQHGTEASITPLALAECNGHKDIAKLLIASANSNHTCSEFF